jgi:multiple sugar transport system permease protein
LDSATVTRGAATSVTTGRTRRRRLSPARVLLHVFLAATALAWLFPVVWAVFNSFRDYDYTSEHGYVSLGGFTFQNYLNAWEQGEFTRHFLNSLYITVPAVLLTLLSSPASASGSTWSCSGCSRRPTCCPSRRC